MRQAVGILVEEGMIMQNARVLALVVLLGSLQAACGDAAAVVSQTRTGPTSSANSLAEGYHMTTPGTFDVRAFGALGDGSTDDTAALQKAIDAAAQQQATVFLPAGVYRCSTLTLRPQMGLLGRPAFSYRANGGTILKLNDPNARCLLDMTSAIGATVEGLCLDGNDQMGQGIHGILVDKEDYGRQEDAFRIERCRISNFSGHGILLSRIWCFSVRHCMVCFNKGNGIRIRGWDGFVLDNWLSGNGDAGYGAYDENSSVTVTANRIEWNGHAGIEIHGGSHYNITGNYVDRSSGPAVKLMPRDQTPCRVITITGNVIYRSGAPHRGELEPLDSSHLRFEGAEGLVCTGNTFTVGRDDGGKGKWSPEYGIVCRKLTDSVIKDNVLWHGAMKAVLHDLGQHGPNVIIRDNVGSTKPPAVGDDD